MKDKLIKPEFNGASIDEYLRTLGVTISPRPKSATEDNSNIRIGTKSVIYGFKEMADASNFIAFLEEHNISYGIPRPSIGARYPYHVAIDLLGEISVQKPVAVVLDNDKQLRPYTGFDIKQASEKTSYKPDEITRAKELKNITVRSQDYYTSANLRDIEKYFMEKIEQDKLRTI